MTIEGYEPKPVFDIEHKGFRIVAHWPVDHHDALVTITRDGKPYRKFKYAAYKVYNLAAHFEDIVEGELRNPPDASGYEIAGSTLLGGCVMPEPVDE